LQAHIDLLDPERPLDLDDPAWPVLGRSSHRLPARVEGPARLRAALLSPGTVVGGPGGDGPALVGEETRVPDGATVAPGGRFGGNGPEEASR
jgi:ADP-glucose pyrophosphorylase